jgi:FHA domain-containing protein/double zinc ribbon protein
MGRLDAARPPRYLSRRLARFSIRYLNYDLELPLGAFTIGRSPDCQLALDDPLISRRHATLHVADDEVIFEDLGSRNGSTINGEAVRGKRKLIPGDKLGLGSQEVLLVRLADVRGGMRTIAPCSHCGAPLAPEDVVCQKCGAKAPQVEAVRCTACGAIAPAGSTRCPTCGLPVGRRVGHDTILRPAEPETRQTSAFRLLAGVADKALAMGRVDEGERILTNLLRDFRAQLVERKGVEEDSLEDAARYAIRLAEVLGKNVWLDWVFEVYRMAGAMLPGALIDVLHALVRKIRYPIGEPIRAYVADMRAAAPTMSPADRFLLKRLEGLRDVCASQ